ncbi:MAG: acyl-CoA thioesterase, partial [Limnohabitans sp.]|nr:acyl-CoA thioesterase [Limnohabitans sp.]
KNPSTKYKIRFTDCDMFGHLNNSRYFDYFFNAREDHLKKFYNLDLNEYYKNDLGWVVKTQEIIYVKPALFNEVVTIQSTLLKLDSEQLDIEIIMLNDIKSHIKAIMRAKIIPIDLKTGRKTQHNSEFMNWAKHIENNEITINNNLQERVTELIYQFKSV